MDPEHLLSHRAFVRGLARKLLLDESRVDDVEQQTWVAALGRGPREPGRLRGWLAAVTRNFARRALRDEALRRAREAEAGRPEPAPPAEEFLEHEARRREVVEAVLRLDEPYRTVVLLRWFKELPPRAIARRLGIPVETVKTRLKRGHERLRVDLDVRHGGDRSVWSAWLVPLAWPEAAATGAVGTAISGAWAMKATATWVAGGLAAATVVVMLVRSKPEDGRSPPPEWPAAVVPAAVDPAPVGGGDLATDGTRREEVEAAAAPADARSAPAEPPAATVPLEGVVLDPRGAPVADAVVRAQVRAWSEFSLLDRDVEDDARVLFERRTGGDGRFSFPLLPGRAVDVVVEAEGYPVERLESRFAGEALTVRLQAGARVFGTITRAADGMPVEGVVVRGFRGGGAGDLFAGATDAHGRFDFGGVAPGDLYLEVRPHRLRAPGWTSMHLEPGEVRRHDAALEEGVLVHGRVTDAETGAPIAGAELSHGWTFRRTVTSGADGRYELPGFGASGVYDIHVRAAGYGKRETPDLELDPGATTLELDFELLPARRAVGRIVDGAGRPVADAYVAAVANEWVDRGGRTTWGQGTQLFDWVSSRSGEDGRFAVEDLRPDARHALFVRAAGFGVAIVDFPADEPASGEVAFGDVVLAAPAVITGAVVDQNGRPVPRAEVTLTGSPFGRFSRSGRDAPWFTGYVDERETRADSSGRFVLSDVAPGRYVLLPNRGRDEAGPPVEVVLAEGETVREVELRVERGLEITGRVVGPHGGAVSAALVTFAPTRGGNVDLRMTGADGSFTLKGLDDVEYRLVARPVDGGGGATDGVALRSSGPADVAAGARDVVLRLRESGRIAGRVTDAAGDAVARAVVDAYDQRGRKSAVALTGVDGRFELSVEPLGRFRVEARRTTEPTTPGKAFDLAAGPAAVVEDVAVGTADLEIVFE